MIALNKAAPEPVTMAELVEEVHGLVIAGHETTANWLTISLYHLLRRPERWRQLLANPETAAAVLEETLRFDGPVLGVYRRASEDTMLGGVPITAGQTVYCAIGGANRDEHAFKQATMTLRPGVQMRAARFRSAAARIPVWARRSPALRRASRLPL